MSVLISTKGSRYHLHVLCPGLQQGKSLSTEQGKTIHPMQYVTVEEARRHGKHRCKRCGGAR